jgi:hypothetical protein
VITFDNITAARDFIMDYRASKLLDEPEAVIAKVRTLSASPSPVDQIVRIGEYLYAHRSEVADPSKDIAGGLIAFATINGWHGLLADDRGNRIVQALRRDLGETPPPGLDWPDPETDPPAADPVP